MKSEFMFNKPKKEFDCYCGFCSENIDDFYKHEHKKDMSPIEKLYRAWGYKKLWHFIHSLTIDFMLIGVMAYALIYLRSHGGFCVTGIPTQDVIACQKTLGKDISKWANESNYTSELNLSKLFNISVPIVT